MASPPPGVYVSSPTFFRPAPEGSGFLEDNVDVEAQLQHSILLARAGVRGVVLLGSIGEAIHLSGEERVELIAGVIKGLEAAGYSGFPVVAGVLTNGVHDTLAALRDCARAGAPWGLVLAPGYFGKGVTQTNLLNYFNLIADQSPLPILIYNCPGFTNQLLVEASTYKALARHPKIVGCKMTHNDVSAHIQITTDPEIDHSRFRVYSGASQQLAPVVLFGAAGVVDGLAGCYPKTAVRLMKLADIRPVEEAALSEMQAIQLAISRGKAFFAKTGLMGIREAIIRKYGLGSLGGGRLPMKGRMADREWDLLSKPLLADLDKIEASLP
ncbi:dihydrodipicolinate synthetase [Dactylonectria macrodidyma]|uniref:Dihydrodipicolinate synthetase n=1 Tax=Dactylonectria macrodidyma TaxID=307937 RepID=A0A9P9J4M9_9HYPO|nr:dihydrodipicolinate synthetase [Dactylonectria macrodidyma]